MIRPIQHRAPVPAKNKAPADNLFDQLMAMAPDALMPMRWPVHSDRDHDNESPSNKTSTVAPSASMNKAQTCMALPLIPQVQRWTFDLSAAHLLVQTITLNKVQQGQLNVAIQLNNLGAVGMVDTLLPKLRQRLADKVGTLAIHTASTSSVLDDDPDSTCFTVIQGAGR